MNLFVLYLWGKDYNDDELKNYHSVLKNYRRNSSIKNIDMLNVLYWAIQCYAEYYFEKGIEPDKEGFYTTLEDVHDFLENFGFIEIIIKQALLDVLIGIWKRPNKRTGLYDTVTFMLNLRWTLEKSNILIASPFKKDSFTSLNFRNLKKQLEKCFGKEFTKQIKYEYFTYDTKSYKEMFYPENEGRFDVDNIIYNYIENQNYNQLIGAICICLEPFKNGFSFISAMEYRFLIICVFKRIREIEEEWLEEEIENLVTGEEIDPTKEPRDKIWKEIKDLIHKAQNTLLKSERMVQLIWECFKEINIELDIKK